MDIPLQPKNDLEYLLTELHAGEIDPETFAQRLLHLQVFMPVQDEKHAIAGFQRSTQAQPLVLEADDGSAVLVLFSAPERAKVFMSDFPGYSGGLLTEFSWVLRRMADNVGIALNPGMELGIDFDTDMIAMMLALLPEEGKA
ncbi:type III secretion system (T3SS) SseB-like protein [Sulfuritortus calidifontis]|uniref:Type III secretion system (T3SS) SseB-like protein n=1 Tax=Sulfuritortus calidifontis TaxID=1914471 RepID=A0A4R3JZ50_9PROT|nr:SseB family protein [Sulfuritortus calidifontis]TCS72657.1 type III secretion system (T3SS) SseB-like protein [Sulfuritortus calidifontis]